MRPNNDDLVFGITITEDHEHIAAFLSEHTSRTFSPVLIAYAEVAYGKPFRELEVEQWVDAARALQIELAVPEDTEEPVADALDDTDVNPGHEAAKWRRQYRDTEKQLKDTQAELDGSRELVIELRRAHVERLLPDGVKAEALWAVVDLDDVMGEHNVPDEKLIAAASELARQRLGIPAQRPNPASLRSGASVPSDHRPSSWQAAFAPTDQE
jgi:hypothetical protein